MNGKILLVDDDPNILSGFRRQLRKQFEIVTANGGIEALDVIQAKGPFAVIVSDMRMPEMDGVQFLQAARELSPDSVRLMLTGNADQQTATDAVNEGRIFRFLNKPCSPEVLAEALLAAQEQFRLITAEKELLTKTLGGSVNLLTDVLSLVNPLAFGRVAHVRRVTRQLCTQMDVTNAWEVEVAAMLCLVGCITVPEDTLKKLAEGKVLTNHEAEVYRRHPQVGFDLVSKVPRLEGAARIIAYQHKRFDGGGIPVDSVREESIPLGARILKAALDVTQLAASGFPCDKVLYTLKARDGSYDPRVLAALEVVMEGEFEVRLINLEELEPGLLLEENIVDLNGDILIARGHAVTETICKRLKHFAEIGRGIREPIRVRRLKSVATESP